MSNVNKNVPSYSCRRRNRVEEPKQPIEIKHTFSSVLRECAHIINNERKENEILRQLMEGGRNPSTIWRIEEQRKQEERIKEMKMLQERHLSALQSREDAILAKQLLVNNSKLQAEKVRKEKQELCNKLNELRQNQNRDIARIVEKCHAMGQAAREAFNSMIDEKRKKAAEIIKESRQLKLILANQKEEEAQRKIHLIQEIKAMQTKRSKARYKNYDPAESSGQGLLCEMSLAELREKLLSMKTRLNEEVLCRNNVIRQERERRKNLMQNNQRFLELRKMMDRSFAQKLSLS
ncbi:cilia- and flagella-associated protein 99-like isoform X2 [Linepithema humile]|uniref:cilia- and flagella-associated protein 99-like isoform X2 n=1 Tax=Linepithema humile TaxID=83485 RepID=UPI00351E3332